METSFRNSKKAAIVFGGSAAAVHESVEKSACMFMTVKKKLRMPLDTEKKRVSGCFHCFDNTIGRKGAALKSGGNPSNSLMVSAVYFYCLRTNDRSQKSVRYSRNVMGREGRREWLSVRNFKMSFCPAQVLINVASHCNVDKLDSSANSENRLFCL